MLNKREIFERPHCACSAFVGRCLLILGAATQCLDTELTVQQRSMAKLSFDATQSCCGELSFIKMLFEYYPTWGSSIGPLLARFQQISLLCFIHLVDTYKAATTGNLL